MCVLAHRWETALGINFGSIAKRGYETGSSVFMFLNMHWADTSNDLTDSASNKPTNPVVLMVEDHQDASLGLKQVLKLNGYHVIDTDNGQEAVRQARQSPPGLLLVDIDVPLLYGLVAARQIVKNAQVGPMPVVVVTHEEVVDTAQLIEVGANSNEYVTRLSNYAELKPLLDYLLPVLPRTEGTGMRLEPRRTPAPPTFIVFE